MALIPCPACRKEVSRQAPTCPHCRQPIAGPPRESSPQKIVVEQPRSGGSGALGCILLLLLGGGAYIVFGTDVGAKVKSSLGITVTEQDRLVGRWRTSGPFGISKTIEFFPDGTFKSEAILGASGGRYRVVSPGKIEIDEGRGPFGVMVHDYQLSGDRLTVLSFQWERVK
jgi:hypothetical protein